MFGSKRGSVSIEALIATTVLIICLLIITLFLCNYVDMMKIEISASNMAHYLGYETSILPSDVVLANVIYHQRIREKVASMDKELSLSNNIDIDPSKSYYDPLVGEGVLRLSVTRDYGFFEGKSSVIYHFRNIFKGNLDHVGGYVYITNYGEKYHKKSCWHLYASKIPISVEEAIRKGYEACKNCGG